MTSLLDGGEENVKMKSYSVISSLSDRFEDFTRELLKYIVFRGFL